jgi:rod shape-determining protein MreD
VNPWSLPIVRAIALMVVGIVLQTTVISRVEVFGITANIVVVFAILAARWLDPRASLLLGFTSGMFLDLLGTTPVGLKALVLTVVVYGAIRLGGSSVPLTSVAGVWPLSILAEVLSFVLLILIGDGQLLQAEILGKAAIGPLLNVGLAFILFPIMSRIVVQTRRETFV